MRQSMEIMEITKKDPDYPKRLLERVDAPQKLYILGDKYLLNKKEILGIVGSRSCSEYGRKVAHSFANELSKVGITIISGLAIGIDTASHIGAMEEERKNHCCFRRGILSCISKRK